MANKRRTNSSSVGKRHIQGREKQQNRSGSSLSQRNRRRRATRSPWLFAGGTLILVAVIIGFFVFLSNQPDSTTNSRPGVLADATMLK